MAKHNAILVKTRSVENVSRTVRARALKMGATCVNSCVVGPDIVECSAEFKKNADASSFRAWTRKMREIEIIV